MSKYCVFMLVPNLMVCDQDSSRAVKAPVSVWQELDEMEKKIQELNRNIAKKVQDDFASFTTVFDSRNAQKDEFSLKVNNESDYVVVNMTLPELSEKGVEVDAKGDNLEGSVETKAGGKASFEIIDGLVFKLSYRLESKKSEGANGAKQVHIASSSSSRIEYLPVKVENLEDTKVELKDNTLKLYLPKFDANPKKDWKKLSILK